MKFLYSVAAIVTFVVATLGNASVTNEVENNTKNFRGLTAMKCKTDNDCYQPCTKTGCPKPKICYKNRCRNAALFEKCNTNYCKLSRGETCCNESCGICAKKGEGCIKKLCVPEYCGSNTCGLGEYCCNESCGICSPLGGACTDEYCYQDAIKCGTTFCGKGQYCCNPNCNTCAFIGDICKSTVCLDQVSVP